MGTCYTEQLRDGFERFNARNSTTMDKEKKSLGDISDLYRYLLGTIGTTTSTSTSTVSSREYPKKSYFRFAHSRYLLHAKQAR